LTKPKDKTKPAKKPKTGRPGFEATQKHLDIVEDLASKGASHEKIAKALKISLSAFKRQIELFRPHIKKGRDNIDEAQVLEVEASLFKKARGWSSEEVTVEDVIHGGKKVKGKGKRKVVTKYHAPSDVAMMFYLVNRMPDRWQSINKEVKDRANSFGEIQSWFREMEKSFKKGEPKNEQK